MASVNIMGRERKGERREGERREGFGLCCIVHEYDILYVANACFLFFFCFYFLFFFELEF